MAALTLPSPRTPDPMAAPVLRWGLLGTGYIAGEFVGALRAQTRQVITAVGSRAADTAVAFAHTHCIPAAHGSYADLVSNPDVDIVYVASPHSEHHAHALLAIDAGKPVLVEKAFTRNAAEARSLVAAASRAGVYLQEAMWTRFLPGLDVVRQCLADGMLGDVVTVFADHGQPLYPNGPRRLWDPTLAGGALLDLGIYPVSFASFVLRGFGAISAQGVLTPEGVDLWQSITVRGQQGGHGVLHSTMAARTPTTASINGTLGRLELGGTAPGASRWYAPGPVRFVEARSGESAQWAPTNTGPGLHFQAAEAARNIANGQVESALLPIAETVAIMEALDQVRAQLGVLYPGELTDA